MNQDLQKLLESKMKSCRFMCYCNLCALCDEDTYIHCGNCVMKKPYSAISTLPEVIKAYNEWLVDRIKLLKEQELPKACEDYSGDMDERVHFDDGYTEALSDISSLLTP